MLQQYREVDYSSHPNEAHVKDMYQSKKIIDDLGMNYEKINVCEKNRMLFW
jgi:hypothetical protein